MECTQAEAFEQYIRICALCARSPGPAFRGQGSRRRAEEIQTNALRCNALLRQNEALLAQFVYDRDPAS